MFESVVRARRPLALLAFALVLGGWLRFAGLGARELSADEGASWAAAAMSTAAAVLRAQARLNPGELGLHDLALHFWIGRFGDSLAAMRALSAAGTIAIALVFALAGELLRLAPRRAESPDPAADPDWAAALAALIFAVNLVTIKYSREARMYSLALMLVSGQVWCFARLLRGGSRRVGAGAALLTVAAAAANLTGLLVLLPETLYLGGMLVRRTPAAGRRAAASGLPLAAGLLLMLPLVALSIHLRGGAPPARTWSWIPRPTVGAPVALFNKGTGTYAFPLLIILAATGIARQWATRRAALSFMLLWMLAPPAALLIASYAFQPAFVERYLLACFVPLFLLAALGLLELRPALRPGAAALVVAVALAHVAQWERKPHGVAFAEATAAAAAATGPADTIGVAPRYAASVVRYYLRDTTPARAIAAADAQPRPAVVIIADTSDPAAAETLDRLYPRILARFDGVGVRGR